MTLPTRPIDASLFESASSGQAFASSDDPGRAAGASRVAPDAGAEPAARTPPRLLQAAAPLLRALAAIQCAEQPPAGGLQALHDGLAGEVVEFCRACDREGVRHEHMLATRYALCTALDEALSCKPWAGGEHVSVGPWSRHALLQEFHREGEGGKTVFLLIARLAAQPRLHRDVLEVMLHILALGFMGDYRRRSDGQRELDGLRQHLLELIGRDAAPVELAPHARCQAPAVSAVATRRSWWLPTGVAMLLLALAGTWLWSTRLERPSRQLRENLLGLRASIDTGLRQRAGAAAAADLRAWLQAAPRGGAWELVREGSAWRIRFAADRMFETGSSALRPQMLPSLSELAQALRKSGAHVIVVGYTDDTPRGLGGAASNLALSLGRADEVASQLRRMGVDRQRIDAQGRGPADPLGDNTTPAGRARNRRVEIVLPDLGT
jgi:type VI secretion system protein ImpK